MESARVAVRLTELTIPNAGLVVRDPDGFVMGSGDRVTFTAPKSGVYTATVTGMVGSGLYNLRIVGRQPRFLGIFSE